MRFHLPAYLVADLEETLRTAEVLFHLVFHPAFAELVAGLPARLAGDAAAVLEYVAWSGGDSREFEEVIITPNVVPTVLAALLAITRFPASWSEAVAAAIGLGGDVDTLGRSSAG